MNETYTTQRDIIRSGSRRRPLSCTKVESMISGDDTVGEYFGPLYEPGTSPPKRKYRKQFEKIERMPEVRYW